jgi:hypothetical protein
VVLSTAGLELLILAELTWAVYKSAQGPVEDCAAIFLKLFVPASSRHQGHRPVGGKKLGM